MDNKIKQRTCYLEFLGSMNHVKGWKLQLAMYTCIRKIKNRAGVTQLYCLESIDGTRPDLVLPREELKTYLWFGGITVDNLSITSNGNIIEL